MPKSPNRAPSEMEKIVQKPLQEYAQERFLEELNEGLGLDLLLPYFEDGCTIQGLNKLLTSLPEFGAKREREDVYTRGELVMHTLARFVAFYAKKHTLFEPLAPIPLDEEEVMRQADIQERFIQNRSVRSDLSKVFAGCLAQHVETERAIESCINLLGDRNFQYHFARYLTALTRPDLLQRDRPGEWSLENSNSLKEYRIYRSGVPLPPLGELEKIFSGCGTVSELFDGRPFERDPAYEGAFSGPGESILAVRTFDREIRSDGAINKMKNTHHPATETDLYDLSLIYPDLQSLSWLVACGSSAMCDGYRHVAVLSGRSGRRILVDDWFGSGWRSGYRFLFVRK